jgi:O-antigen/teichoic acid export membrane protein
VNAWLRKIQSNNNFLSLANNGLVAVFSFLSFIMLVRMVPQDTFGEWVLFLTAGGFLDMLRFGITRTAIIRFLAGAQHQEAKELIGSNNLINFITTLLISIILIFINLYFHNVVGHSGFGMFFTWYPLLAFANLAFNNAQSILQAQMRFDKMLWLRLINVGSFMLFLTANLFVGYPIQIILIAYIVTNFASSVVASIYNWDGIRYSFRFSSKANRLLINFGKYTTGTLIGSNLLKSSDAFILGLSPFTSTVGVAIYSIPLKLTEIIEIPLRSFTATAFPNMSKAAIENDTDTVRSIFYQHAGGMTIFMLVLMVFSFIFAESIVYILGGEDYIVGANIFRIFCIYGLLLPLDRYIGVALDSINKPRQNFYKVIYMAGANIVGDSIMVFLVSRLILVFSWLVLFTNGMAPDTAYHLAHGFTMIKTLELVAAVTIGFTLVGIGIGYYYLNKELGLDKKTIFVEGFATARKIVRQVLVPNRSSS